MFDAGLFRWGLLCFFVLRNGFDDGVIDRVEEPDIPTLQHINDGLVGDFVALDQVMEQRKRRPVAMEEEHEVFIKGIRHDQRDRHESKKDSNDEGDVSFFHLVELGGEDEHRGESGNGMID